MAGLNHDNDPRGHEIPDEAPETPTDEREPTPIDDPPAEPIEVPLVVDGSSERGPTMHEIDNGPNDTPVRNTSGVRKERRGFASMSPEKQREIASKGGRAAHEKGTAHEWTSEEARSAGRKGGQISRGGRGRLAEAFPEDAGATSQEPSDKST
jgi:uncharacterized protein